MLSEGGNHAAWIEPGIGWIDLDFLGIPHAVGAGVLRGASSVALVDPGPSTCLHALERGLATLGLGFADVSDVLLTHIHLDHAGAAGTLVRRYPRIRVHVHERGASHLVEPGKLINSAARYFGAEMMGRYWGEILPVPVERLTTLGAEATIRVDGRELMAAYTPGHAVHHVAYLDLESNLAFVGDAAGIRINSGYVLPPTPPPDIDLDQWLATLDLLASFHPQALVITHGGRFDDVEAHLEAARAHLNAMAEHVRLARAVSATVDEAAEEFGRHLRTQITSCSDPADLPAYEPTTPLASYWYGLDRYWQRHQEM